MRDHGLGSDGERAFETWLRIFSPTLAASVVREYEFHPTRRWRFDFAWPNAMIAVEIDGGRWAPGGGRHASDADFEKLNEATALGWWVFHFRPKDVREIPADCIALIRRRFIGAGGQP